MQRVEVLSCNTANGSIREIQRVQWAALILICIMYAFASHIENSVVQPASFPNVVQMRVLAAKQDRWNRTVDDLRSNGARTPPYLYAEQSEAQISVLTIILYMAISYIVASLLRRCALHFAIFTLGNSMVEMDSSLNEPLLDEEEDYRTSNYSDVLRSTHEDKSASYPWVSVRSALYL